MRRAWRAAICGLLGLALALGAVIAPGSFAAEAATGSDFHAGMIISDADFYDSTSMDIPAVQAFLDDTGSPCRAGYTCLRDYRADSNDRPAETSLCAAYAGRAGESSASIFVRVGSACGVNPQSLIVLVQKEQGLVTATAPTAAQYDKATGYGCPDFSVCDSKYYGFFNQVYSAARQFKRYRAYESSYSFRAGRTNSIGYNPLTSCGGSQIYIDNQATAGLYNYTPYQPNAAALANLYGTGDSCSAYGNRNFWRDFTDWFGAYTPPPPPPPPPPVESLVRGASDPTVYVVAGDWKYPVADVATLQSLAPLGAVAPVADSRLAGWQTGVTLARMFRSSVGGIYFFDLGRKLHVPTCDMVADYGYGSTCGGMPTFTDAQIAAFATGADLTDLYQAPTRAARMWITDGRKRQIYDEQSATQAGLTGRYSTFSEDAIATIGYGPPVLRPNVLVQNPETFAVYLYQNSTAAYVSWSIFTQTPVGTLPFAALDPPGIATLPRAPALNGFVRRTGSTDAFVLQAAGKAKLTDPAGWGATFSAWTPSMLALLAATPALSTPTPIKGVSSDQVYLATGGQKRPVLTIEDLIAIAGSPVVAITTVPDDAIAAMPTGPRQGAPGSLAKSSSSPEIFLLDGLGSKIPVISPTDSTGLGLWPTIVLSDPVLATYARTPYSLSIAVRCGANRFLAAGGVLAAVSPAWADDYGLTYTPLDALTCATLNRPAAGSAVVAGPIYLRSASSPTIYQVSNDQKRAVADWAGAVAANGGVPPTLYVVNDTVAAAIPTGPPLR